ncbi:MAG: L-threonylcarbamoyladenylate synthase [Myxococcota bacterium]
MSHVHPPTEQALSTAAQRLRDGGLVGLPTETVYGLAANGLDALAVASIYNAKQRPSFNPLILHTHLSLDGLQERQIIDMNRLGATAQSRARALANTGWPGPLTLVLPRGQAVPDLTTAGLDTVAVRVPSHPVARALLAQVNLPLAAPSANRSGRISPTTAFAVADEFAQTDLFILDGGPCQVGLESTVVHIGSEGTITLLRPGFWSRSALESSLDTPVQTPSDAPMKPRSPGMGSRHYAPTTPFLRLPAPIASLASSTREALKQTLSAHTRVALLCWDDAAVDRARDSGLPHNVTPSCIEPSGDLQATARKLYQALRDLDATDATLLIAEPFPPEPIRHTGLGFALRDRISRATTPFEE